MVRAYHEYAKTRGITEFTVTGDHLKLLRRAYISWEDCEFGAPAVDCKRPYGNSDVIRDIGEILGHPVSDDDEVTSEVVEYYTRLHAETAIALQVALVTGEFRAGSYVCDKYHVNWRPAPGYELPGCLEDGL